jgi:membrane associated rhomboid family serine protease
VGWLLVLLAGAAGNGLNALLHQSRHLAIGASTAVFGAIGILGAIQFWGKWRLPGQRLRALLPLGAGIALLGFLGAGRHTDLMGHLFGFIAGIGLGLGYAMGVRHPLERMLQGVALALAIGLLGIAWAWGWSQ